MSTANAENLLRQKASTARRERETREMTPARALRLGFARVAGQLWELPVDVLGVDHDMCGLEDLPARMGDGGLLMLLDGPDGARGALSLDLSIMAAMTEVQTIGVVSPKPPPERVPTPTDAAMVVPWLDGALEHADLSLVQSAREGQGTPHDWMIGYRFGAMAENARSLALALNAPDFHCLSFRLDVGVGMRQGTCTLLLPAVADQSSDAPVQSAVTENAARDTMMNVAAEMRVIAARVSLTLAEASRLAPGDTLPIDAFLLNEAELQTDDGTVHGRVRLGKVEGHWAVRFDEPGGPESGRTPQARQDMTEEELDAQMLQLHEEQSAADSASAAPDLSALDVSPAAPSDLAQLPATTENLNFE